VQQQQQQYQDIHGNWTVPAVVQLQQQQYQDIHGDWALMTGAPGRGSGSSSKALPVTVANDALRYRQNLTQLSCSCTEQYRTDIMSAAEQSQHALANQMVSLCPMNYGETFHHEDITSGPSGRTIDSFRHEDISTRPSGRTTAVGINQEDQDQGESMAKQQISPVASKDAHHSSAVEHYQSGAAAAAAAATATARTNYGGVQALELLPMKGLSAQSPLPLHDMMMSQEAITAGGRQSSKEAAANVGIAASAAVQHPAVPHLPIMQAKKQGAAAAASHKHVAAEEQLHCPTVDLMDLSPLSMANTAVCAPQSSVHPARARSCSEYDPSRRGAYHALCGAAQMDPERSTHRNQLAAASGLKALPVAVPSEQKKSLPFVGKPFTAFGRARMQSPVSTSALSAYHIQQKQTYYHQHRRPRTSDTSPSAHHYHHTAMSADHCKIADMLMASREATAHNYYPQQHHGHHIEQNQTPTFMRTSAGNEFMRASAPANIFPVAISPQRNLPRVSGHTNC
jgi:hypothetical protein